MNIAKIMQVVRKASFLEPFRREAGASEMELTSPSAVPTARAVRESSARMAVLWEEKQRILAT